MVRLVIEVGDRALVLVAGGVGDLLDPRGEAGGPAQLLGDGGGVRGVRLGELLLVEDQLAVAVGLDADVGERGAVAGVDRVEQRRAQASRTVASPASAPAVLVVELYFVWVVDVGQDELTASTRALAWVLAAVVSRATVDVDRADPTAAAETVMSRPGTTSLKVFVAECSVSPPIVIAASRPATTVAPPSRSLPSEAVRVTVLTRPRRGGLDDEAVGAAVELQRLRPRHAGARRRSGPRRGTRGCRRRCRWSWECPPTVSVTCACPCASAGTTTSVMAAVEV